MLDFQLPCLISLWVGHSPPCLRPRAVGVLLGLMGAFLARHFSGWRPCHKVWLKPMGPIFWWMNIHLSDVLGVHERKKDDMFWLLICFDLGHTYCILLQSCWSTGVWAFWDVSATIRSRHLQAFVERTRYNGGHPIASKIPSGNLLHS